ncbi:MAG: electron transfer flavoprotein subunit beta/FixA family protein [Armatimonadota bacterium]
MNIIVSIKQVPDTAEVKIDPETNTLMRESAGTMINPFDENAVEEGLRLREQHGGKVTVITMGPPQAEKALRDALAMGADEAVLITDMAFAIADTLATSYTLSRAIQKLGDFDLVLCGKQAFDGDTAQVGPGLAEHLGIPQITYAIEVTVEGKRLRARRLLDNAFEVLETRLPALLTVVKQINEPRLPRLKNVLAARKKQITVWGSQDLDVDLDRCGFRGSPTEVIETYVPTREHEGEMLEGDAQTVATDLVARLRQGQVI